MTEASEQRREPPGPVPTLLPWHEETWSRISAARRAGRLPHALLLEGVAGLGKRRFARLLAASLLCAAPREDLTACGTCRSCHLLSAGNHPAFRPIEPEQAGGQIRIDAIRECVARGGFTSQGGGYKITLIHPAEAMNTAAANAFLKTLEEPAPWTLMLLISEQPARLPATIRSRCQRIAFAAPSAQTAVTWLSERVRDVDPQVLLALGAGSPLKAEALAQGDMLKLRERRFSDFTAVLLGEQDPVATAQSWQDSDLRLSIEWMWGWGLDLTRIKASAAPPSLFNRDRVGALEAIADRAPAERLHRLLITTLGALRALETQLNPHLLLEDLLLEWALVLRPCLSSAPRVGPSGSGSRRGPIRES